MFEHSRVAEEILALCGTEGFPVEMAFNKLKALFVEGSRIHNSGRVPQDRGTPLSCGS
jgi:hypothetical protein